ncbi:hypothetical protein OXX80_001965 [Metschnikowia pulcherrima]
MAAQEMSQRSARFTFAGLLLVVDSTPRVFFYEKSRSGELEVSLEKLISAVPGTGSSVGEDMSASVKIEKDTEQVVISERYDPLYEERRNDGKPFVPMFLE